MSRVPAAVRRQVQQRAGGRCEYCGLPEALGRLSHQVDHILPPRHLGSEDLINFAWACFRCNNNKGTDIGTVDLATMQRTWLYNPREQRWDEHFEIDTQGYIVGKTTQGRATARLLEMNIEPEVELRRLFVESGQW